jgi:hypothetical protein
MIDYKYPTIASGPTPSGALVAHPMKSYFEKIINEDQGRKFRVHYRWQKPENKLEIFSHRDSGFKNPAILAVALANSKISRSQRLKKSKFEEVKD